jgi:hypothetical protein
LRRFIYLCQITRKKSNEQKTRAGMVAKSRHKVVFCLVVEPAPLADIQNAAGVGFLKRAGCLFESDVVCSSSTPCFESIGGRRNLFQYDVHPHPPSRSLCLPRGHGSRSIVFGTNFDVGRKNSLSRRERAKVRGIIMNAILSALHPDLLPQREGTHRCTGTKSAEQYSVALQTRSIKVPVPSPPPQHMVMSP